MKKVKVQRKDDRGFLRRLFGMKDRWGHKYDPTWMEQTMEDEAAISYHMAVGRDYNVVLEDI